jgi:hypothetical protein
MTCTWRTQHFLDWMCFSTATLTFYQCHSPPSNLRRFTQQALRLHHCCKNAQVLLAWLPFLLRLMWGHISGNIMGGFAVNIATLPPQTIPIRYALILSAKTTFLPPQFMLLSQELTTVCAWRMSRDGGLVYCRIKKLWKIMKNVDW